MPCRSALVRSSERPFRKGRCGVRHDGLFASQIRIASSGKTSDFMNAPLALCLRFG